MKPLLNYTVKAKLEDNSIIDLPKDCDCVIHDGPHWVYMDCLERLKIKENIKKGHPDVHSEMRRIERKERMMNGQKIIELILPFPYDDPRWSWFTYRQTINHSDRTKDQIEYDEWLEGFIDRKSVL